MWSKPECVEPDYLPIMAEILKQHKFITILADKMFMSEVHFLSNCPGALGLNCGICNGVDDNRVG